MNGRAWTIDDKTRLTAFVAAGRDIHWIAKQLDRTPMAVAGMGWKMGLPVSWKSKSTPQVLGRAACLSVDAGHVADRARRGLFLSATRDTVPQCHTQQEKSDGEELDQGSDQAPRPAAS